MVKLTATVFGKECVTTHDTVKGAAQVACCDMESNEGRPLYIYEGGVLVWENGGPFDGSYARLQELAGIQPDYHET